MKNKIFCAWLRFAHRVVFVRQLNFGIFFLNLFGNKKAASRRLVALEHCAPGTLGRNIWDMLQANNLDFVPYYETHDLKHALLGYRQEAPDEIRMQAFMFGNAGFSLFSIGTFLLFVIWTPDVWSELLYHFRSGRLTKPIGHWQVEEVAHRDLEELRLEIGLEEAREKARNRNNRASTWSFSPRLRPIRFLKTL